MACKAKGYQGSTVNRGIESPERYVLQIFWATLEDHTATGFVFGPFADAAYQHALRRAFALYRKPATWARVRQTGMRQPLGWAPAAQAYRALYQRLVAP